MEYTSRARQFMKIARQMGNVVIDYDIFLASLRQMVDISRFLKDSDPPAGMSETEWCNIHIELDPTKIFTQLQGDYELLKKYGKLYESRAIIGYQEACPVAIRLLEYSF